MAVPEVPASPGHLSIPKGGYEGRGARADALVDEGMQKTIAVIEQNAGERRERFGLSRLW